jgi:hypothetical protein
MQQLLGSIIEYKFVKENTTKQNQKNLQKLGLHSNVGSLDE